MNIYFSELEYSESKELYEKTVRIIQMNSKTISFFFVYLLPPIFMLPKFVISVFAYFTTDLGNDALEMPFPMW